MQVRTVQALNGLWLRDCYSRVRYKCLQVDREKMSADKNREGYKQAIS